MLSEAFINKDELKKFLEKSSEEMKNERSFILSKINTWMDKIEASLCSINKKEQKRKELIEFGKFISCFNKNVEITDALCESPDILFSLNDKNIGIELTDLVIRDMEKRKEGSLKKLFNQIENELKKESNEYNGIYQIGFIGDIAFSQKNQIKLKSDIKNLIKGEIQSGNLVKLLRKSYHTDIHIYHSKGWCSGALDRNTVESKIKRKEGKISNYISDRFEEIWLLLVIGGAQASDDYSSINEDVYISSYKTGFDRIFIFDFFRSKFIELKKSI